MSVTHAIDADAKIVYLKLVDEITIQDWTATMHSVLRSPDWRPGFGFLADRRGTAAATVEFTEQVLGFMTLNQERLAGARWALVTSDAKSFAMARIGKALAKSATLPIAINVFEDVDAAERWLRLTAPGG